MHTTSTPPKAEQLRAAQQRLGVRDAALWLLALPVLTDMYAVGYSWGHITYRHVRIPTTFGDVRAALVAEVVTQGHTPGDSYLDVDTVTHKKELLRVVDDGVFTTVIGGRVLWDDGVHVSTTEQVDHATLVTICTELSETGQPPHMGVFTTSTGMWLLSKRGNGIRVHTEHTPVRTAPKHTHRALHRWAHRIGSLVGLGVAHIDNQNQYAVLDAGETALVVRADVTPTGQIATAVPTGWTFMLVDDAPIPAGWHIMGVTQEGGKIVVQHSVTGICGTLT